MSTSWLMLAAVIALLPLGSPRRMRLALLAGAQSKPLRLSPHLPADASGPVAIVIGAAVAASLGPALGGACALAVLTALAALRRGLAARVKRQSHTAALQVVRATRAEIEAGASPADALAAAAHAGGGLHSAEVVALAQCLHGHREPGSLDDNLVPLAHALRVSAASGAPAGPVLDRVAAQLQAAGDQRAEVAAVLAGSRASATLLALLPAVGLVLGAGLGANPVTVLVGSAAGHALALLGVGLECAGLAWTQRLAAGAER